MHRHIFELQLAKELDATKNPGLPNSSDPKDFLSLYLNSQRESRKHEHGLNYCLAMAELTWTSGNFALSCDWLVALADISTSEGEFLRRFFAFLSARSAANAESWPAILKNVPPELNHRLLSITIIRVLNAIRFDINHEQAAQFVAFTRDRQGFLDVYERLKISDKKSPADQVVHLKQMNVLLDDLLKPVVELSGTTDLNSVLLKRHAVLQALNDGLVRALLSPSLPKSFSKTTLSAIFSSIELLVASKGLQFIDRYHSSERELQSAIKDLESAGTYYSLNYLLPLVSHLFVLVKDAYEKSDAIQPALLNVKPYPRKYPFHEVGANLRLRFFVENRGPGPAFDIQIHVVLGAGVMPQEFRVAISELSTGRRSIELDVTTDRINSDIEYLVDTSWRNSISGDGEFSDCGNLQCQRNQVDWDQLADGDPYSTEAIDSDSNRPFAGRQADVRRLVRLVTGKTMGSAYIYGQKRVGKTSLCHEVTATSQESNPNLCPIYLEGGDFVQPTAEGTIQNLGMKIVRKLRRYDPRIEMIPVPAFTNSLSPLNDFIDEVIDILSEIRILIILDEFDELPIDLFKRGDIGNGFFLTIRALSGRSRVGLLLIGGEKMGPIISAQGDQLNRFQAIRIDYFRREEHWADFEDLVRLPVSGQIEYSDGAIECIYRWSAGNPFFTNVICGEVLRRCCERRDAFVSDLEAEECAQQACEKAESNIFAHFWEDGVLSTGIETENASIRRRRILLGLASALRCGHPSSCEVIGAHRGLSLLNAAILDSELKSFVERGILLEKNDIYSCRVYLFQRFLIERSAQLISIEFTDHEERVMLEQEDIRSYVTSREIGRLIEGWGVYGSLPVTEERVRSWIDQFESNKDKRLMFRLLQSITFYSEAQVREKLSAANAHIGRTTIALMKEGDRRRRDVLVTYLDGVSKSGVQYARLFRQEAEIYHKNVMGWDELQSRLSKDGSDIRAVVVVDDIIGTGNTIINGLTELNLKLGGELRRSSVPLFVVTICGYQDAIDRVSCHIAKLELNANLYCSDVFDHSDRAFHNPSKIFESEGDTQRALDLATTYGERLERKWPLGHGGCQSLIVFFLNCPNNTLPIFYKDASDWKPLFPRR